MAYSHEYELPRYKYYSSSYFSAVALQMKKNNNNKAFVIYCGPKGNLHGKEAT